MNNKIIIKKDDKICRFFVGTYTMPIRFGTGQVLEGKGKGIYRIAFDEENRELWTEEVYEGIDNPSYLALSPNGWCLYAVNELKEYEGQTGGSVSAFRIEESGGLRLLNVLPTKGEDPCHVAVDAAGKNLYVANFMSGSIAAFGLDEDGSLRETLGFFQHEGRSLRDDRQAGPHAHSVTLTPDGSLALAPDLGIDRVEAYRMENGGRLEPDSGRCRCLPPGSGPRYCTFSPDGHFCYLINELSCSITVFACDRDFSLRPIQTVSSIPGQPEDGKDLCAHLALTPDGKFLYSSNRGHDSISAFKVGQDGKLAFVGNQSCGGKTPRHFCVTPSGRHLLCGNQDSDSVTCFSIGKDGMPEYRTRLRVPTPVCVLPWS